MQAKVSLDLSSMSFNLLVIHNTYIKSDDLGAININKDLMNFQQFKQATLHKLRGFHINS